MRNLFSILLACLVLTGCGTENFFARKDGPLPSFTATILTETVEPWYDRLNRRLDPGEICPVSRTVRLDQKWRWPPYLKEAYEAMEMRFEAGRAATDEPTAELVASYDQALENLKETARRYDSPVWVSFVFRCTPEEEYVQLESTTIFLRTDDADEGIHLISFEWFSEGIPGAPAWRWQAKIE